MSTSYQSVYHQTNVIILELSAGLDGFLVEKIDYDATIATSHGTDRETSRAPGPAELGIVTRRSWRRGWLGTYHPLTIRRLTSGALRRQAARRRPPSPPAQPADRRRGAACLCAEHGRYTCQPDYMPTTCWPMVRGGPRLEAALSFIGHRFAAAWVRVRAAFDDGQAVSIQETSSIVRAFSYLSGSNGGTATLGLPRWRLRHDARRL